MNDYEIKHYDNGTAVPRPVVHTEREAFEGLARKLVKVPKSEIDSERAKADREKPAR